MKKFLLSFALLLGLTASAAAQQTILRVNSGGPAYTDTKGQTWQADFGFDQGIFVTTSAAVVGTSDPALYQTGREDSRGSVQWIGANRSLADDDACD